MALKRLLKIPLPVLKLIQRDSHFRSSLYIPSKYLQGFSPAVFPDLDIKEYLQKKDMSENLKLRSLERNFDVQAYLKVADRLDEIDGTSKALSFQVGELNVQIKNPSVSDEKREDLKKILIELKGKLKELTDERWRLEECVVDYFQLPNYLHSDVEVKDVVLSSFDSCENKSKVDFATASPDSEVLGCGNDAFYLIGSMAELELNLCHLSHDFLLNSGCEEVACPDFTRTFVVEGCEPTVFKNPESFLCLSSTRDFGTPESGTGLHLTGGASLYGFIGLLVKHLVVNPESLPATFFCVGRQYKNLKSKREKYTIFDARQSTAVQIFDISKNEAEMSLQFEKWTSKMTEFYSKLNVKYRIVKKSSSRLREAESFGLGFEIFSSHLGEFVEVGNLSLYDDFLSKRLQLKYEDEGALKNLFIVSGTFLNITKMIVSKVEKK